MTPQEEQECLELAERIGDANASPWEPLLVGLTFMPEPVKVGPWALGPLTMRGWLALDVRRSPFLIGAEIPAEEVLERIAEAISVLAAATVTADQVAEALPPEAAPAAIRAIRSICGFRFATSLAMVPPIKVTPIAEDGFGRWAPVYTALIKELRMTRAEAFEIPVVQALALLATARHNEGYTVGGENWRIQEVEG